MSDHGRDISPSSGDSDVPRSGRPDRPSRPRREESLPPGSGGDAEPNVAQRPLWYRVLRTAAIGFASAIGFGIVVLLLLVLALQTNWGGTHFADFLLAIANPFDEAQSEYDELRGNFISRLELRGLHLFRLDTVYVDTLYVEADDGDGALIRRVRRDDLDAASRALAFDTFYVDTLSMAAIDTFRMRYNLLSLLGRRVDLREVYFANPVLTARQRADSTWDLLEPFRGPDTTAAEPSFVLEIGEARVTDGSLFARYHVPEGDSVFRVEDFNLQAADFRLGTDVSGRLDTLHTRYTPPGFDYWTHIRGGGLIRENEVDLSRIDLESPYSLVAASGTLRLPSDDEEAIEGIDFSLEADPIAFRDVRLFVPALDPDRTATLRADVEGSTRKMNVDVRGTLSDGGSFSIAGVVSPLRDGPIAYRLRAGLQRINPAFFTTPPEAEPSTLLTGEAVVDLAGARADALSGSVSARLDRSAVGGLRLEEAVLTGDVHDGRADVDLRMNWNGSTATADGFIRPFDDLPSYELSGHTRNFNLGSLAGPEQQSDVNADIRIVGYGFSLDTADLKATLTMGPSTINDVRVDDGRIDVALQGGELTYGIRFLFPEGLLVANGDASLDDPTAYRIQRGRFENFDLAALVGGDRSSSLTGSFQAQVIGSSAEELTGEAVLEMEPSTFGEFRLAAGRADLRLSGGRLDATVRADLSEAGDFDFAAVTRPFDDVPTLHVTRGEFRNVNVNAFLQDSEHESNLSGTATFTMRGFEPEFMSLDGAFTLSASRINEQEINSARIDLDMDRGNLAFDAGMDLPDGDVHLVGTAQPFRAAPAYDVREGTFENIDLAAFTGNPNLGSRLNGTLTLTGTGLDPETMDVEGRVEFSSSRINEQEVTSAFAAGSLRGGTLDVELQFDVPDGRTHVVATARPFAETPTYTVHEGTFRGVNVAALTGNPAWQTNLSGSLSLTGEGFVPRDMSTEGLVRLSESTINQATVTAGTISGSVRDGRVEFDADVAFEDGVANVSGSGLFFADVPQYAVSGRVTNLEIADLIGNDTLRARISAAFDVEGTGTDPRTMDLQGRVTSEDGTYEGAEVESLYGQFLLRDGILRVDSLFVRSTAIDANGSGVIAVFDSTAGSDFSFTADLKDLRPLRTLIASENFNLGEGRVDGRVYGRTGTLQFDVTGRVNNLVYDNARLSTFDGTLAGELGPDRTLSIAEIDGEMRALSLPGFLIEDIQLRAQYQEDQIVFEGSVTVDDERSAQVAGRADLTPGVQRVTIDALTLDLAGRHWELLQEAGITYGEEYRISNFLLYSDDQQIAVDGIVEPDGEQNLVMTIEEFEMGAVADLLGYEGLGGILNGSLILSGPGEAPVMSGTLNADLTSSGQGVGELRLGLDYEDLRLNVDARLSHDDGSTLTARGYVPFDLRLQKPEGDGLSEALADRSVDFSIAADSFSVGWIDPFLDPDVINEFEGRLSGGADVSGTLDNPVLDGDATYIDGRIGLVEIGLSYRDIHADLAFRQNQVRISNLRIRSGGGTVTGDGTINLAELTLGEFDVDLLAESFLAVDSREYSAIVDGQMHLAGTTRRPVLEGDLQVVSADIYLTEQTMAPELERVELSQEDLQTLEQRFGVRITEADTTTFDFYDALAMNLNVQIERNTWIRSRVNPVMDIQFSGSLDLIKDHYSDLRVFGTIDVVEQRSRIVQFGKRFNITSGTLTFNGPPEDPYIDIAAEYDIRTLRGSTEDVTITLSVRGQMSEQLDLTLGSEPSMAYADIVSYIATGQPASASLQLGGLGGTGADLAVGQLATLVEGIAGSRLGLDVVTIDQTGGAPTVTAGKYVTSRFFVSVSQLIGDANNLSRGPSLYDENTPVITLEYEVQNWLLLRLLQGGSIIRMNVLVEYAY